MSSNLMPPDNKFERGEEKRKDRDGKYERSGKRDVERDIPGIRAGSLTRNMSANKGQWLRHARPISRTTFPTRTPALAMAKAK